MYHDILVPTDGSETATAAVEHAVDLAGRYGARLHALYVVDSSAYASVEMGADMVVQALETEGEAAVAAVREAGDAAGLDVETAVRTGLPHRTILEYADEMGVDLVVMGTHGRRGLDRFLLGSVTERVVRTADVPVLTVRRNREE